jgi:hypothetical protein
MPLRVNVIAGGLALALLLEELREAVAIGLTPANGTEPVAIIMIATAVLSLTPDRPSDLDPSRGGFDRAA